MIEIGRTYPTRGGRYTAYVVREFSKEQTASKHGYKWAVDVFDQEGRCVFPREAYTESGRFWRDNMNRMDALDLVDSEYFEDLGLET